MAIELKHSLPICDHTPRALRRTFARRGARPPASISVARHHHVLPRSADDRRRPHAIRVGRNGQAVFGLLRRHRHDQRRSLPSEDRGARPRANRPTAAHDDDLSPPGHRPVRREARRENAARSHPLLLHQQRQRGERSRHPLGPRVHRQPGRDRPPQRLPRRHLGADEPHRPRQLEVQKQQRHEHPSHARRLLLPLPVRPRVSIAAA